MSGKPAIPEWQRASSSASTDDTTSSHKPDEQDETNTQQQQQQQQQQQRERPVEAPTPTEEDIARADGEEEHPTENDSLLEQASRFLEDPAIRDEPREKKAAFLESKGLSPEDIERLLGEETQERRSAEVADVGERVFATAPPKPTDVPQAPPQPREIPPIVTYPEFLANTEKPPPLITAQRLANTAYITGGFMASIYGLSKYIIAPMTHSLAESRRDFASHTQGQLKELNERLGKAVSVDPASRVKPIEDGADDVSEADSDPTELYHRDYGTQTTPNLSRRPSTSTDPYPTVTAQENRLKIIKSHLQELEANRSSQGTSRDRLRTKVSDLTTYLHEMDYQNQYYPSMGRYGSSFGWSASSQDSKNDQIEVLKSDIRAVKGVFLSARNFPTGGVNASPIPTGRVGS